MLTQSIPDHLLTAWEKLKPQYKLFFQLLQQQVGEFNQELALDMREDKVALSELFLTLVYSNYCQRDHHEIDVLAAISSQSSCRSTHCILLSSSVNFAVQNLNLYDQLTSPEQQAFANISQLMCTECTFNLREHTRLTDTDNQIDILVVN